MFQCLFLLTLIHASQYIECLWFIHSWTWDRMSVKTSAWNTKGMSALPSCAEKEQMYEAGYLIQRIHTMPVSRLVCLLTSHLVSWSLLQLEWITCCWECIFPFSFIRKESCSCALRPFCDANKNRVRWWGDASKAHSSRELKCCWRCTRRSCKCSCWMH